MVRVPVRVHRHAIALAGRRRAGAAAAADHGGVLAVRAASLASQLQRAADPDDVLLELAAADSCDDGWAGPPRAAPAPPDPRYRVRPGRRPVALRVLLLRVRLPAAYWWQSEQTGPDRGAVRLAAVDGPGLLLADLNSLTAVAVPLIGFRRTTGDSPRRSARPSPRIWAGPAAVVGPGRSRASCRSTGSAPTTRRPERWRSPERARAASLSMLWPGTPRRPWPRTRRACQRPSAKPPRPPCGCAAGAPAGPPNGGSRPALASSSGPRSFRWPCAVSTSPSAVLPRRRGAGQRLSGECDVRRGPRWQPAGPRIVQLRDRALAEAGTAGEVPVLPADPTAADGRRWGGQDGCGR